MPSRTNTNSLRWAVSPVETVDFEAVYQEELPRVYNFFRFRFGDNSLAEDLTATTFEKAWKMRQRYRSDRSAFTTWLFTIARRVAIDQYRRASKEIGLDEIQHLGADSNLEELIQTQIDLKRLKILIARLAERDQELVALKYGAGLTNRAIAHLSGLSETNVGVILYRAVQTLREEWKASYE